MAWKLFVFAANIAVSALLFMSVRTGISWLQGDVPIIALAVGNAFLAFFNGAGPIWDTWTQRTPIDHYARIAVETGVALADERLNLPPDETTASVFRVTWKWRWSRFPFPRRELTRARDGRSLGRLTTSSSVPWTVGKGAIGEAWKNQKSAYCLRTVDMGEEPPVSRKTWKTINRPMKFSWKEVRRVWEYKTIIAYAIIVNDSHVVGAVSIASTVDAPQVVAKPAEWKKAQTILDVMADIALNGSRPAVET